MFHNGPRKGRGVWGRGAVKSDPHRFQARTYFSAGQGVNPGKVEEAGREW